MTLEIAVRCFRFSSLERRRITSMTTPAKNKPKKQSAAAFMLAASQRIAKEIPSAELEALPRDGAKNHDHYLYGAPKKTVKISDKLASRSS